MLVQGDKFAERFRCEPLGEERIRWTVALEDAVRHEPLGRAFRLDFLGRFAKGQRLGLGEDVRQQYVMMPAKRIEGLVKRDEVTGDEACSLMNQLIEGVLAVGSRFTPINGAGIVAGFVSVEGDVLAIALHRQLLEISRKSF